jgi:hypothetical protein
MTPEHCSRLGPAIDPSGMPPKLGVPVKFALDIARSAVSLYPDYQNRVTVYATGGSGALAAVCYDPGSGKWYVAIDVLAPFQVLETLHRLHANAESGAHAALTWIYPPSPTRLIDGDDSSPSFDTPRARLTLPWALGFLALHEFGHIVSGHLPPGESGGMFTEGALPRQSLAPCRSVVASRRQREVKADKFAARLATDISRGKSDPHAELNALVSAITAIFLLQAWLERAAKVPLEQRLYPSGLCRALYVSMEIKERCAGEYDIGKLFTQALALWDSAGWGLGLSSEDVNAELQTMDWEETTMSKETLYCCPFHPDVVLFTFTEGSEVEGFVLFEKPATCPMCEKSYFKKECTKRERSET